MPLEITSPDQLITLASDPNLTIKASNTLLRGARRLLNKRHLAACLLPESGQWTAMANEFRAVRQLALRLSEVADDRETKQDFASLAVACHPEMVISEFAKSKLTDQDRHEMCQLFGL